MNTPTRPLPRLSPRLIGGVLLWGVMEAAALRRSRRQRVDARRTPAAATAPSPA